MTVQVIKINMDTTTCSGSVCVDDILDLENIQSPCVAVDSTMCTSCENIEKLRAIDARAFNDNPLYKVFGIAQIKSAEAVERFWQTLHTTCGIPVPIAADMTSRKTRRIVQPSLEEFGEDLQKITRRVKRYFKGIALKKVYAHLLAFQQIALLPYKWNAELKLQIFQNREDLLRASMKQDVLQLIERYGLDFGGCHYPRELPVGVSIYVHELARATPASFESSLKFMLKQRGCAEGVLQLATDKALARPLTNRT